MEIRRFKRWYQVVKDSMTKAQLLTREEAEAFVYMAEHNADSTGPEMRLVSMHRGYTVKRIDKYP